MCVCVYIMSCGVNELKRRATSHMVALCGCIQSPKRGGCHCSGLTHPGSHPDQAWCVSVKQTVRAMTKPFKISTEMVALWHISSSF